ncbi:MAG TPA: sigma-70 family RNA polymerase sigma factor [Rubricoccaceae bacterium]
MRDLAPLLAALPFPLDDTEAAGQAFADGRGGDAAAGRNADLWAYIWTVRYVTRKFLTERSGGPSDLDAVLTRAYEGVLRGAAGIEDPLKFPSYVSVVCKNAVLSHRERRRVTVEIDESTLEPVLHDDRHAGDGAVVRGDVADAIAGLPEAVRAVARMRILDGLTYEEIAEATGHPLPTVRTYLSKANGRLRALPALRAHHYDDVLPPGALGAGGGP